MYLLRRAAVRSFSAQTRAFVSKPRTLVTKTPSALRAQQWQVSSFQRRFASEEASPTPASTTGETVPAEGDKEAVESEQSKLEESESKISEVSSTVAETAQSAAETVKETATSAVEALQEKTRNAATEMLGESARSADAGTFSQPKPSKILYVGNLFFDVATADLEREFARFGEIVNCRIAQDPKGLSRGFAYVEYSDVNEATKAIENLDQQIYQGRRLAVQYHVRRENRPASRAERPQRAQHPPSKTLFIGNMSFQMSDKDLNDLFRPIRNVVDVRVAIDRRSGQPRGFAHADFVDIDSAEAAKKTLQNKTVFGRQLRIDFGKDAREGRETMGARDRGSRDSRDSRDSRY